MLPQARSIQTITLLSFLRFIPRNLHQKSYRSNLNPTSSQPQPSPLHLHLIEDTRTLARTHSAITAPVRNQTEINIQTNTFTPPRYVCFSSPRRPLKPQPERCCLKKMFESAQQASSFALVLMPRPIKTLLTLSSPAAHTYLHI